MLLAAAAFVGFVSVAFGAYSEHGLRPRVSAETFRFLMTAVRYNQVHALAAAVVGGMILAAPDADGLLLRIAGWGFVAGMVLFSGSIYVSALLDRPALTKLAPVGGTVLMLAWLALCAVGIDASVSGGLIANP